MKRAIQHLMFLATRRAARAATLMRVMIGAPTPLINPVTRKRVFVQPTECGEWDVYGHDSQVTLSHKSVVAMVRAGFVYGR